MYAGGSGFDPVWMPTDPNAYTVRYGLRALVTPGVFFIGMFALFLFIARDGTGLFATFVVGCFAVLPGWLVWRAVKRIYAGTVALGVDGTGVYLGEDDDATPPELVPWAEIEAVVYYRTWTTSSRGGRTARNHVGVIVKRTDGAGGPDVLEGWADAVVRLRSRRIQGWQLDISRLAGAVQRYAPRVPIRHAPDMGEGVRVGTPATWLRHLRWPPPGSVPYPSYPSPDGSPYDPAPSGQYRPPGSSEPVDTADPNAATPTAPDPAAADPYGLSGGADPYGGVGAPAGPYPYPGGPYPGGPWPAPRPRLRTAGLGCLGTAGMVIIWLFFAVLPLGFIDDLVGQATQSRWSLFSGQPTRISVPAGTTLAVEIEPDTASAGVPGTDPTSLHCTTRDGDADPVELSPQNFVVSPGGNSRIRLYDLVTRTGRFEITCSWTGGFSGPELVRANRPWLVTAVLATRLAWFALVTFLLVRFFRRIMRAGRRRERPAG